MVYVRRFALGQLADITRGNVCNDVRRAFSADRL
jgi:hypothetical protein